jgi:hypothetical protein
MNLQKIEQLITRYENGETTTAEEKMLFDFFNREEVPFHLRSYKAIFQYHEISREEHLPDVNFDEKLFAAIENKQQPRRLNNSRKIYSWVGIAASIIILLGMYFQFGIRSPLIDITKIEDTYSDPELAYAETKKILMMISGTLNSGTEDLKNIKEFDKSVNELNKLAAFDEGLNDLQKIAEFEKAKKIITSKK